MKPISEIAYELSEVLRNSREDGWVKVAERAQQLFAPTPTLLERTRAEIAGLRTALETLQLGKQVWQSFEYSVHQGASLDWWRYRLAALLDRELSLLRFTPEWIRGELLPQIGDSVVVDREWWSGRCDRGIALTREVWSLRYGELDGRDILCFYLMNDHGIVIRDGLAASDFGKLWRYATNVEAK